MKPSDRIYVAGHRGMVGSAIVRRLREKGYDNLITRTREELDLTDQEAVRIFFEESRPDLVFLAAAKVGGIHANNIYRAEFLYDNLQIQNNIIHQSYKTGVEKLLFLGSSCIYPKMASQPLKEEYLLTGPLEPTNEPYAIAKLAGIKLCENYRRQYGCDFISVLPTNLYGPNDNYDLETSHVLPAIIRKIHDAYQEGIEEVEVWGTGTPRREFMHVDDLADACMYLMQNYSGLEPVNIGTGQDLSIRELVALIADIIGFKGSFYWNTSKPDGTPRKLMDVSKLNAMGWAPEIDLRSGIEAVYRKEFLNL